VIVPVPLFDWKFSRNQGSYPKNLMTPCVPVLMIVDGFNPNTTVPAKATNAPGVPFASGAESNSIDAAENPCVVYMTVQLSH
jgi:hypothetical protein